MQSLSHNASSHVQCIVVILVVGPSFKGRQARRRGKEKGRGTILELRKIEVLSRREEEKRKVDGEKDLVRKEKRTLSFRKYYLVSTDNDTLASYLRPSSIINPTHQSRYPDIPRPQPRIETSHYLASRTSRFRAISRRRRKIGEKDRESILNTRYCKISDFHTHVPI